MKYEIGWWWPDGEIHMVEWMRNPKNHVTINGRLSYQGKKQIALLDECARHFDRPLCTAIDVGAHIGLWSNNLAVAFQRVEAFEPVEVHRDCFCKNVLASNVHLNPCALGAEEGSVNIWSNPTSSGDSWVNGMGDIPMRTLDGFQIADVDLIKIDCEGYELNVLRGAEETISLNRPVIIVEQKRDMAARFGAPILGAVEFLKGLGYRVSKEISGDYIMVP